MRVGETRTGRLHTYYPMEMIRAVTVVWLFAGIRGDEIRRLRLGCVRWQEDNGSSVCFLDVPVNKTATAFTKPVDGIVGQAINAWEKVRPAQEKLCDDKTGEMVDFLFLHRMRPLGGFFLNHFLIPRLCRKAGVPQHDLRGKITGHRARSTIATQLFNAKEPMSLYELQEWLGHRMLSSTQRYAKITPTKLMKSYADAGYFSRNLRAIEVLIDQEKVRSGVAADEAWKFYDLGHGYCTYDFFDQCPHRMACAKCSFYMPKGSTAAALLEGKSNLLRMRQEIPLSDAELAALDDGVSALESLLSRLADVPTPAGPTPLELREAPLVQIRSGGLMRGNETAKWPSGIAGGPQVEALEVRWVGCIGCRLCGVRCGGWRVRFRFAAVELAHDIGADRPRGDLRGLGLLALAVRLLVGGADERAFDEDVSALLDVAENVFGETWPKDCDAVPLGLRDPLVLGVLPGSLCGDAKTR